MTIQAGMNIPDKMTPINHTTSHHPLTTSFRQLHGLNPITVPTRHVCHVSRQDRHSTPTAIAAPGVRFGRSQWQSYCSLSPSSLDGIPIRVSPTLSFLAANHKPIRVFFSRHGTT